MSKLSDLPVQALAKVQQSVGKAAGKKYWERGGSAELHYARKMFEAGA